MHSVAVAELPTLETTVLGPGRWQEISQQQIDQFAEATCDHQWIHVDPERAASRPLRPDHRARVPHPVPRPRPARRLLQVRDAAQAINYGLDKARFPAPSGSRVRLSAVVEKVEPVPSGFQVALAATVECDAGPKPACAAQVLYRFYGRTQPTAG